MEGITLEGVISLLGIIVTVGGATAVISRWLSPYRTLKGTVERHSQILDDDLKRFKSIDHDREEDRAVMRSLSIAMLAVMDHEITGNSLDKLRAAKERLQEQLIEH